MLKLETLKSDNPPLQIHEWPPVASFGSFPADVQEFLDLDGKTQQDMLINLRGDEEKHGAILNKCLGIIYAYIYGYKDSPVYLRSDPALELKLMSAKLICEEELINFWLPVQPIPNITTQQELVVYLRDFIDNPKLNHGVYHEFWDYIRDEITYDGMREFLRLVLCRTEIVDDECALLLVGLQGNMKKVMASNLWDECGNGVLSRFHTYWLRRMLEKTNDWEGLPAYRSADKKPWSSGVLSNMFNVLLTRPGYKLRAYGCFLITESWVEPHFARILGGLERVGLDHEDIAVYFLAHCKIDPHHTAELIDAMEFQTPELTPIEISEILRGTELALAGAHSQYRGVLVHLREIDRKSRERERERDLTLAKVA